MTEIPLIDAKFSVTVSCPSDNFMVKRNSDVLRHLFNTVVLEYIRNSYSYLGKPQIPPYICTSKEIANKIGSVTIFSLDMVNFNKNTIYGIGWFPIDEHIICIPQNLGDQLKIILEMPHLNLSKYLQDD
jgi:hypothetical protein